MGGGEICEENQITYPTVVPPILIMGHHAVMVWSRLVSSGKARGGPAALSDLQTGRTAHHARLSQTRIHLGHGVHVER